MNNDDSIDLRDITPLEYSWTDNGMSTGFIAQEISTVMPDPAVMVSSAANTVSITIPSYQYANVGSASVTSFDSIDQMEQRLTKLEKIIAEEAELRAAHPAVKNAYDEYRFLAELAKSASADDTDA
jgi:hypothetical protein